MYLRKVEFNLPIEITEQFRTSVIIKLEYTSSFGVCHRLVKINIFVLIRVIKKRRMRWTRHVARIGQINNTYNILDGKPERKRQFGRLRSRLDHSIKMELK
jgi:hypothetical protein